jgi:hypothetical protein
MPQHSAEPRTAGHRFRFEALALAQLAHQRHIPHRLMRPLGQLVLDVLVNQMVEMHFADMMNQSKHSCCSDCTQHST